MTWLELDLLHHPQNFLFHLCLLGDEVISPACITCRKHCFHLWIQIGAWQPPNDKDCNTAGWTVRVEQSNSVWCTPRIEKESVVSNTNAGDDLWPVTAKSVKDILEGVILAVFCHFFIAFFHFIPVSIFPPLRSIVYSLFVPCMSSCVLQFKSLTICLR